MEYSFININAGEESDNIEQLFPSWKGGEENICIISPHDDDALLGAGYLILIARKLGARVCVMIVCNGSGGYSTVEEKDSIVDKRKVETRKAYEKLGLREEDIIRLDYDDFSVWPFLGHYLPGGGEGTINKSVPTLRKLGITRLVIPNGYREHLDHEASFMMGFYDGPQSGDPILMDWGAPTQIESYLQYSVWSDFCPEDAMVEGRTLNLRANRAIWARPEFEDTIVEGIREYKSQEKIIDGLVERRKEKSVDGGFLELYIDLDPRPKMDYGPYKDYIKSVRKNGGKKYGF